MTFTVFRGLVEDTAEQRRTFFKFVFGEYARGYVCVSYLSGSGQTKDMRKTFFKWPYEIDKLLENVNAHAQQMVHAYFGVSLYENPSGHRDKSNVKVCTNIWADLDECDPRRLLIQPSILIQTSPGKYQGIWLLEEPTDPAIAEAISCKIAYYHAKDGADKCWDSTHVFRIPYTQNFKYGDMITAPIVTIVHAERTLFRPIDFDVYPAVSVIKKYTQPSPPPVPTDEEAEEIFARYSGISEVKELFYEPIMSEKWSGLLWLFINRCCEYGLTEQDTFAIAKLASFNKYKRDNRPDRDLWREVNKAFTQHAENKRLYPTKTSTVADLLTQKELTIVQSRTTFVERYIELATKLTDGAVQYHQAGAFIILSYILSKNVRLSTSFGMVIPNLWFMILGDSTITRKTTTMNIAMKLLYTVDEEALLATDGSLEGILVGMSGRPGQPAVFLKDEFTGLLEAIAHKDYMAGFSEQLTKLYDGDQVKRLLRKEIIDIKDPVFIMYVNGIKSKTQMMITDELVSGGFLPRFIIITAEPDLSRVRPVGPPVELAMEEREVIKNELIDLHNHYSSDIQITRGGANIGRMEQTFYAELTDGAWDRYNEFESLMMKTALNTGLDYLTPVYDRLAKSTLKAAILIAASTQRSDVVKVSIQDILHAIYYARQWREYSNEIINGVGKTYDERIMDRIYRAVRQAPLGITRGELMSMFHMDAKRADLILKTMEQRLLIVIIEGAYRVYV